MKSLEGWFRPSLQLLRYSLRRFYPISAATAVTEAARTSPGGGEVAAASPADSAVSPVEVEQKEWSRGSRRTGLIAIKLGMTQLWDREGMPLAVTVLQVIDNQVVMVRTKEKHGYDGLQIGAINHPKVRKVKGAMLGQFRAANVPPKRKLMEFRVSSDALLPVGTPLHVSHFKPGQYVDVCSKSIGKGFQGVMKRHHMKGQPASHGVTKTHRKMGATGGGQDPGRIMKGKRMPGRMGNKRVTTKCLKVYRLNTKYNVIYVRGPVPGHKTTYVRITDAKRKPKCLEAPFPTFIPDPSRPQPEEVYAEGDIHVPHEGTLVFEDKRKKKKK